MGVTSGNDDAPESKIVKVPFEMGKPPPASDQNSKPRPSGPTSRKSRSSGKVCVRPSRKTPRCRILPQVEKSRPIVSEDVAKSLMGRPTNLVSTNDEVVMADASNDRRTCDCAAAAELGS